MGQVMFESIYCPNKECPVNKLKKDQRYCSECGEEGRSLGVGAAMELIKAKTMGSRINQSIEEGSTELLVTDKMTTQEIRRMIYEDMLWLANSERGTGWMRAGSLLTGDSTQQMIGAGFKALINQNKVMIRQNELLLRAIAEGIKKPNEAI